jgi:hypothetical protein
VSAASLFRRLGFSSGDKSGGGRDSSRNSVDNLPTTTGAARRHVVDAMAGVQLVIGEAPERAGMLYPAGLPETTDNGVFSFRLNQEVTGMLLDALRGDEDSPEVQERGQT